MQFAQEVARRTDTGFTPGQTVCPGCREPRKPPELAVGGWNRAPYREFQ
jgi:hypothetical protein